MTHDPMRTVTFGVADDQTALFDIDGNEITTESRTEDDTLRIGSYEYESEPLFGSSTEADGEIYIDKQSPLIAIVTYYDRPKAVTLFNALEDSSDVTITAPEYPQEASAQFYQTFGFNGYTTSFRQDLKDFTPDSSHQYIEPDERMQEAAMHSRRNPSDDWLNEITMELIEDGYYVSSMDCMLEVNGGSYSFSNPMRITGIPEEEWDDDLRTLLFTRMRQLYQNEVPTIDEVTTESS